MIEHDCSHGAMAAPASLQRERKNAPTTDESQSLEDRTVIFPLSSVHSENVPFLRLTLHFSACGWWRAIIKSVSLQEDFKKHFIMCANKSTA